SSLGKTGWRDVMRRAAASSSGAHSAPARRCGQRFQPVETRDAVALRQAKPAEPPTGGVHSPVSPDVMRMRPWFFLAMPSIISISQLTKTYATGLQALKSVSLDIGQGEIFALLGPNGAGKTTLISIVCGLVTPTSGRVTVDGFDILREYRQTRARIGLVPQELHTDMFETVRNT